MSVTADTAPGLDLFAAAWFERWRSFGGLAFLGPDERLNLMMPMPGVGGHEKIEGDELQRQWHDGFDFGQWRELETLLKLVPGGREALAAHIGQFPD